MDDYDKTISGKLAEALARSSIVNMLHEQNLQEAIPFKDTKSHTEKMMRRDLRMGKLGYNDIKEPDPKVGHGREVGPKQDEEQPFNKEVDPIKGPVGHTSSDKDLEHLTGKDRLDFIKKRAEQHRLQKELDLDPHRPATGGAKTAVVYPKGLSANYYKEKDSKKKLGEMERLDQLSMELFGLPYMKLDNEQNFRLSLIQKSKAQAKEERELDKYKSRSQRAKEDSERSGQPNRTEFERIASRAAPGLKGEFGSIPRPKTQPAQQSVKSQELLDIEQKAANKVARLAAAPHRPLALKIWNAYQERNKRYAYGAYRDISKDKTQYIPEVARGLDLLKAYPMPKLEDKETQISHISNLLEKDFQKKYPKILALPKEAPVMPVVRARDDAKNDKEIARKAEQESAEKLKDVKLANILIKNIKDKKDGKKLGDLANEDIIEFFELYGENWEPIIDDALKYIAHIKES